MVIGGSLAMLAVFIFGLSAIACRDFFFYYWRAVSRDSAWAIFKQLTHGNRDHP
jgi:hypothetical protein